jgi:hypothetical protein
VFYGYSVTPQKTPLQISQHCLQNLFEMLQIDMSHLNTPTCR